MKVKKNLLTFTVAGLMALLLCVPATVIAGGGPGPGVTAGYKASGPQLKGVLIVGWKYAITDPDGKDYGTVEAFLHVEGNFYAGVMYPEDSLASEFLDTTAADITGYALPTALAAAYNMAAGTEPVVLEEKDVSNFKVFDDIEPVTGGVITYRHMLHCDVKITFLVPVKKQ